MLTSGTDHVMATVSATSGGVVGNAYVQFGDAMDPKLLITSPSNGAAVSGFVPLSISWQDVLPAGGGGTVQTELLVDGEAFCGFHASDETGDTTVNSNELSNGQHEVTAVAIDPEGSETYSNGVWLNVYNEISEISVNETALFLDDSTSQPVTLSAEVNSSESWQITIYRCSDSSAVAQSSGTGPGTASISWSGAGATPGVYDLSISPGVVSSSGAVSPTDCYIGVSYATGGDMLIMGVVEGEPGWSRADVVNEMTYVNAACTERQVRATILPDPHWASYWYRGHPPWIRGLDYWLGTLHRYRNMFLATHGERRSPQQSADGVDRVQFKFAGGVWAFYTNNWTNPPGTVHAFTDYGTGNYPWNIVEINACYSAGFWLYGSSERQDIITAFDLWGGPDGEEDGGVFIGWD